jgi:hypothetical protein
MQKNFLTVPRNLFSGSLYGVIVFKIVFQVLYMHWLICTEGEVQQSFGRQTRGKKST